MRDLTCGDLETLVLVIRLGVIELKNTGPVCPGLLSVKGGEGVV